MCLVKTCTAKTKPLGGNINKPDLSLIELNIVVKSRASAQYHHEISVKYDRKLIRMKSESNTFLETLQRFGHN